MADDDNRHLRLRRPICVQACRSTVPLRRRFHGSQLKESSGAEFSQRRSTGAHRNSIELLNK